jgi:Ser/Thr protein kinase RdoA (MazF antagonist)
LVLNLECDIVKEITRVATKLRNYGVEHRDVRPPNVLWNPKCRKVMLVDFKRSEILKQMPIL